MSMPAVIFITYLSGSQKFLLHFCRAQLCYSATEA